MKTVAAIIVLAIIVFSLPCIASAPMKCSGRPYFVEPMCAPVA